MNTACSTQYLTTVASGRPYNIHCLPMMNTACSTQYLTTVASGRPYNIHCLPMMNTACSTQYLTTVASGRPYNIHCLPHDEHCLLYSIPDNCGIRQTIQHPLVCPMMNTACSTQYLTTSSGRPYNIHWSAP